MLGLECLFMLAIGRLAIVAMPFQKLMTWLHRREEQRVATLSDDDYREIKQISRYLEKLSRHTPWNSQCLTQAVACKAMLNRRHWASTLSLGVRLAENSSIEAHAWLSCGGFIVTGNRGHRSYTLLKNYDDTEVTRDNFS